MFVSASSQQVGSFNTDISSSDSVKDDDQQNFQNRARKCYETYGVKPGTILKTSDKSKLSVLDIDEKDGILLVSKGLNIIRLDNVHNQEDLIKQGYSWYELKERRKDRFDVVERIHHLFLTQRDCDIFFQVRDCTIGGHSLYLATCSDYFRSLFKEGFLESIPNQDGKVKIVPIKECDPEIFKIFLSYLYSGSISIDQKNILEVAHLAQQFDIDKLKKRCIEKMNQIVDVKLAVSYFKVLFGLNHFFNPIVEAYLANNFYSVGELILSFSNDELIHFAKLNSNRLNEESFFRNVLKWLKESNYQPDKMKCFIEDLLPLFPSDDNSVFTYSGQLRQFMSVPEQKRQFEEALVSAPFSTVMLLIHAQALYYLRELNQAKELYEKILANHNQSFHVLFSYSSLLHDLGETDRSQVFLNQACNLSLNSDMPVKPN
jgi:hypothetical protein